jgi:hypothetical protein
MLVEFIRGATTNEPLSLTVGCSNNQHWFSCGPEIFGRPHRKFLHQQQRHCSQKGMSSQPLQISFSPLENNFSS